MALERVIHSLGEMVCTEIESTGVRVSWGNLNPARLYHLLAV